MIENMKRLGPAEGSRIVIAGGCGGIGRALANACLATNLEVAVMDLPQAIDQSERNSEVTYIPFDGRDPQSMNDAARALSQKWDAIDTFVFLSGFPILPRRTLQETSLSQWNELMAVNLTSAHLLTAALFPLLENGHEPAIVTVASSLAYQVMPGMGAYAASKGALVSLTKALAAEYAPKIRVNSVAPGAVETDFLKGGTARSSDDSGRSWFDAISEKYTQSIPLNRVAEPLDVVGPILFLAGGASAYMTGQVLHVNGGRLTP